MLFSIINKSILTAIACSVHLIVFCNEDSTDVQNIIIEDSLKMDQPKHKEFKNTIRFNYTNMAFFGTKSIVFGYERTIKKHQSFSVNLGHAALPIFGGNDKTFINAELHKETKDWGIHASFDYRFYLRKENKYNSPHGIYLAPYMIYNYFDRTNSWTFNSPNYTGDITSHYTLGIFTIGGQMGYQFVLWKRLALDFILFAPGFANYKAKATFNAEINSTDQETLWKDIQSALSEYLPGYSQIIRNNEFEKSGTSNVNSLGYRFVFHIGYRF